MTAFATPTDLTRRLRQDVDTNAAQDLLEDISAEIRAAVKQTISLVTSDVVTLRVQVASSRLVLPQRPAQNPTRVTVGGVDLTGWYWNGIDTISLIPFDQAWWVPQPLIAVPPMPGDQWGGADGFPYLVTALPYPQWGVESVQVDYTHGSDDPDHLQLAKSVCLAAARRAYINPGGHKSETIDDYTYQGADATTMVGQLFPGEIRQLRSRYGRTAASVALG